MEKKVAILLSTYNGEKYLREQLDSILNQTYTNFELIVRDDGSKDNTVGIVKEYIEKSDKEIVLVEGKNLGFIKSFFDLLKRADADYYSFADQDDIWLPNKIELAVKSLNKLDNTKPNMAFSNVDYYDTEMNFIGKGDSKGKKPSFLNSLYECINQGMTMVINKKARDYIINHIPEKCFFHDWWTYMICTAFGKVVQDDVVTVKYRRAKTNATVEGQGKLTLLVWRIKKLFLGDGMKDIKKQITIFKNIFYKDLSKENKKILDTFQGEKYNFFKALKKTFYPKKIRRKLIDDISIRIFFLFGIL
jgi:rhamnosyltransferase